MSSSRLVRQGSISLMLAGAVLVATSLLFFVQAFGQTPGGLVLFLALNIVALLLLAAGMVGLHALQKENYERIGRIGLYTTLVALVIVALYYFVVAITQGQQMSQVLQLANVLGGVAVIVGFALYGIATWQAGMLPRWYAVLLIVFVPLSFLFGNAGDLWEGLVLLVLGYVLWLHRDAATEQPSRVR